MSRHVTIIGGGLAGCEAAHQLARRGFSSTLYEMRPNLETSVHKTDGLAELVCSNSLRSDDYFHPVGLLKREMSAWDSLVIRAARESALPAGSALAVDREAFSSYITSAIDEHTNIELVREECPKIPEDGPVIIASGPLTSQALSEDLYTFLGDQALYFYDAIAPVVEYDSLNMDVIFAQSRYDKGGGADYLNIPLTRDEYENFHREFVNAERVGARPHEKMIYFEGCLPAEVMAERGVDTLRFGPMKPVGLMDPRTGQQPYAVIQLRQDNYARSLWNLVGFQTQLKWGDQKRIFRMLPGMENARFVRFGMIHRNTFVNSPRHLDATFSFTNNPRVFLAGQVTGVEGYVESAASGLMAAVHMARYLDGAKPTPFPAETAMGALAHYVSFSGHASFQPTNINFGIMPQMKVRRMKRREKRKQYVRRAWVEMASYAQLMGESINIPEEPRESTT